MILVQSVDIIRLAGLFFIKKAKKNGQAKIALGGMVGKEELKH